MFSVRVDCINGRFGLITTKNVADFFIIENKSATF